MTRTSALWVHHLPIWWRSNPFWPPTPPRSSGPAPAYQHSPSPMWATNTPLPHTLYESSYVRRAVTFNAHVHAQSAPSDASSDSSSHQPVAPITFTVVASASASTGSSLATITTTTVFKIAAAAAAATRPPPPFSPTSEPDHQPRGRVPNGALTCGTSYHCAPRS